MKRAKAYLVIPLLSLALSGISFIPQGLTARAAARQEPKGQPRSVCLTWCLRTYEKCNRRASNEGEMEICYRQFMDCQQACYGPKAPGQPQ
ncbi:MAG TPA: hypothetical protein VF507_06030 [Pyrinomonadaceae bacterium]|jgi:hypothetical protein